MPLDFPSSPTNGQVYQNYYYDGPTGAWRSFSSTVNPIPSTLKNLTISSTETTGVSLKVTPFTTSSVNLQEWYNTSSTVVASMNVAGDLTANSLTLTTDLTVANGGTGAGSFTSGAYLKGAGTAAITAQIGIPAGDITSGQLAPAQGGVPTGAIMMWYTNTAPSGWLICNGQSTTGYTALAAVVGATVPDMRTRVPVGRHDSSGTFFVNTGTTGGSETVALTEVNVPSHTHNFSGTTTTNGSHTHGFGANTNGAVVHATGGGGYAVGFSNAGSGEMMFYRFPDYGGDHSHTYSGTTSTGSGSGTAHNNLQPYIVINYIIKT